MTQQQPIGIFDSGVGGLTVAAALIDLLPGEATVYFGDTARYPYGNKSPEEVTEAATQVARLLVEQFNVKLLVAACNTASSVCLSYEVGALPGGAAGGSALADLGVPVVGVIEPGVQALAKVKEFQRVGVIATTGTVASGAYQQAMRQAAPEVELTCAACPGFVEFVERGETDSQQALILARRLLAPMLDAKVEALLLGCTHYPFLARVIGEVMGPDVVLVSSADETAFAVRQVLADMCLLAETPGEPAARRWLVSGDDASFRELGTQRLGLSMTNLEVHSLGHAN